MSQNKEKVNLQDLLSIFYKTDFSKKINDNKIYTEFYKLYVIIKSKSRGEFQKVYKNNFYSRGI